MRVFVFEYLTSGACPEIPLDSSLMREGRLMADALLADLESLDGVRTLTMRDPRLDLGPDRPARQTFRPATVEEERALFGLLTRDADAVLIIAPETDNLLADRARIVAAISDSATLLNCRARAIASCADKLTLPRRLQPLASSIVPAVSPDFSNASSVPFDFPVVLKPRFGAGCEETYCLETEEAWIRTLTAIRTRHSVDCSRNWIAQPFVKGIPLSSVGLFREDGSLGAVLPLGRQRIRRHNNQLTYRGGTIPWISPDGSAAAEQSETFFAELAHVLPGLRGYVGADWIWDEEFQRLHLVEINPRLTTSYLGYRELYGTRIAAALLDSRRDCRLVRDEAALIRFDVEGYLDRSRLRAFEKSGEILP